MFWSPNVRDPIDFESTFIANDFRKLSQRKSIPCPTLGRRDQTKTGAQSSTYRHKDPTTSWFQVCRILVFMRSFGPLIPGKPWSLKGCCRLNTQRVHTLRA